MKRFEELEFDNSFSRLQHNEFYSKVDAIPLESSFLISHNPLAAELIGLDPAEFERNDILDLIHGKNLPDFFPLAACYAGHQFGQYVPRLGDGRAILLGQVKHQGNNWDLQLKGAGPTPYSRGSDGRAVLRSTIREYLCSEAMHGLGIETTRALCMTGSNEEVYREKIESGAMLIRIAPSHIRFGSFEYFFYRGENTALHELGEYLLEHYYPQFQDTENPYLSLLSHVIDKTAYLLAQWQAVGFAHGVMNTDNMSIHGITIDYGPFGFLDAFNPDFICNHSDYQGRYAFNKQPDIGLFNLSCLAQAMLPLFADNPESAAGLAKAELKKYQDIHLSYYHQLMNKKLGLSELKQEDVALQKELLKLMAESATDYTIFFRTLSHQGDRLRDMFIDREAFDHWQQLYQQRLLQETYPAADRKKQMLSVNPKYILRNYLLELAIKKAEQEKDYTEIENLLNVMQSPFDEHPEFEHYAAYPPEWASLIEVSCSS